MTSTHEVGRRIIHLREQRGWSQSELAGKSGVAREDISRYECGHKMPSVRNLSRIARAFEVGTDALL